MLSWDSFNGHYSFFFPSIFPSIYSGCFALCVRLINEVKQRLVSAQKEDELNSLLSPFLPHYQQFLPL